MSEESARGEGSSPAQAGEAARQLIRRTRQVTRRKFPAEEKILILLEGIRGEVSEKSHEDEGVPAFAVPGRGWMAPVAWHGWHKNRASGVAACILELGRSD